MDDSKTESEPARKNANSLRYADDITLKAGREEAQKSFLARVKEKCEILDKTAFIKTQKSKNKAYLR